LTVDLLLTSLAHGKDCRKNNENEVVQNVKKKSHRSTAGRPLLSMKPKK
jgi:hypothetical protein